MNVTIYARVSTDDKEQDPERQVMKCKQYCELHNHNIIAERVEHQSGDSNPFVRDAFAAVLNDKPEAIVIYEISRFSREHPSTVMRRLQELKDMGIKIISITEPAFNMEGEMSDLLQYIMAWFNNYYLSNLKRNIKSGMEKARLKGTKSGKPIGRAKAKFNMHRAYELLFNESKSQRFVANELNVSLATINRFKRVCEKDGRFFIKEVDVTKTGGLET